jgi:hypothetical protein
VFEFSGFAYSSEAEAAAEGDKGRALLGKLKVEDLNTLCDCLQIGRGKDADASKGEWIFFLVRLYSFFS